MLQKILNKKKMLIISVCILLVTGMLLAGCSKKADGVETTQEVSTETETVTEETIIYSGPTFEGDDCEGYEGFSHLYEGNLWDKEDNRYAVYVPGEEESYFDGYWIDETYLGVHFQVDLNPYYEDENDSLEKKLNDQIEFLGMIDSLNSAEYRDFVITEPERVENGVRATVEYCIYDDIWQKYDSVFKTYYLRELKNGKLALIQAEICSSDIQENTEELIGELEQFYQFDINWDWESAQQKGENCKENSQTNPYRLDEFSFELPMGWKTDNYLGNRHPSLQVYAPEGDAKNTGCMIAVCQNHISYPEVEKMDLLDDRLSEEAVEKLLGMDITGYESKVAETTLGKTVIISYEIEDEENSAVVTVCTAACKYDVITIMAMESPGSECDVEPALNLILENSSYTYKERIPVEEELEKGALTEKVTIEEELNVEAPEKKYLSKSFIENNFVLADDIKTFFKNEEESALVVEVIGQDREVVRERYVFAGEYLKSIAEDVYGDQDKWIDIYEANKELLGDRPELIYEGQYLILPNCSDVSYANVNTCYENTVENIISWEGITEYIDPNCGYGIQNAIFYYTIPESEGESFMICYPRLISYNGKDVTAVNEGIRECAMKYVDSLLINRSEELEYELRTNEFYSTSRIRSNVNYIISYLDENTISVVFQDDVQEGYIHNYDMRTYVADINTGIRYENEELWGNLEDAKLAEMIQTDIVSQQILWDQELFKEEIPVELIHDSLQTNGYVDRSYVHTFLTEDGVGFAITYRTTQMRGWTKAIIPMEKTTSYQTDCVLWERMPEEVQSTGMESSTEESIITAEIDKYGTFDEALKICIQENVVLKEGTKIENISWVDDSKKCLRVAIQYKEQPEELWFNHLEDYFFFVKEEEIEVLYVDYGTDIDMERIVWAEPDFNAHLEDVNFDRQDDLIIALGSNGAMYGATYCAYLYTDKGYEYCPSFEQTAYNYRVDNEKKCIVATIYPDTADGRAAVEILYEFKKNEFREMENYTSSNANAGIRIVEAYQKIVSSQKNYTMSLIYLDEDSTPELLLLKDGEYKLYTFNEGEVKEITMPSAEIKANAYGPRHAFEDSDELMFYWFEYVPYKGLIRVHGGSEEERYDYYLKYEDGSFVKELKTESKDYKWHTYAYEKEVDSKVFLEQMETLGYDELVPCAYLYEDVSSAYENINRESDTQKVLDDFVSGKTDALCYVEAITDIPEDGFVMRNYEDLYVELTSDEEWWRLDEYVDYDNDGKEELVMHGYAGSRIFLDVIGDTVYILLHTGGTADVASVAEIDNTRVIERTDLTHGGRQCYEIMQYDACGCLVDHFWLSAIFEGDHYTESDRFEYNDKAITMKEFEAIVDSIEKVSVDIHEEVTVFWG